MEITDKDFELVDNYLDGTLTDEEQALFRIRMQDDEFAGLLRFQQQLRKELSYPSLLSSNPNTNQTDFYYDEFRLNRKKRIGDSLSSKMWFLAVAVLCLSALLLVLLL